MDQGQSDDHVPFSTLIQQPVEEGTPWQSCFPLSPEHCIGLNSPMILTKCPSQVRGIQGYRGYIGSVRGVVYGRQSLVTNKAPNSNLVPTTSWSTRLQCYRTGWRGQGGQCTCVGWGCDSHSWHRSWRASSSGIAPHTHAWLPWCALSSAQTSPLHL